MLVYNVAASVDSGDLIVEVRVRWVVNVVVDVVVTMEAIVARRWTQGAETEMDWSPKLRRRGNGRSSAEVSCGKDSANAQRLSFWCTSNAQRLKDEEEIWTSRTSHLGREPTKRACTK